MRVFVAGASAAIGTRLIPQRSSAAMGCSARTGRPLGPEPLHLDLLERDAVTEAFVAQRYASAAGGMVSSWLGSERDDRLGDEFRCARESLSRSRNALTQVPKKDEP
jgi:hypothetical protein